MRRQNFIQLVVKTIIKKKTIGASPSPSFDWVTGNTLCDKHTDWLTDW